MDYHHRKKLFPLFAFFLLTIVFNACNQNNSSEYIQIKEDGLIYRVGMDDPYTGKVVDTLNNRILEYDVVNGLKNGEFKISMFNGITTVFGRVEDNKNIGKWNYYYQNGNLESSGYFEEDKPVGKWVWYYSNGKIKQVGSYFEGKKTGDWFLYDEEGKLISISMFDDGILLGEVKIDGGKFI